MDSCGVTQDHSIYTTQHGREEVYQQRTNNPLAEEYLKWDWSSCHTRMELSPATACVHVSIVYLIKSLSDLK